MRSRLSRVMVESAVLVSFLFAAWVVVPTFTRRPWDFETYLLAARTAEAGLNPYNPKDLEIVARRPVGMSFFYPPITIPLFRPFLHMSLPNATIAWLAIRVVAFLILFQIWRTQFLPTVPLFLLCLSAAFAFNGSVIWDLRTGNVTTIQDLFLWLGFAAYVRGRRLLAAVGILAGSIFKLIPAMFLVLLLLRVGDRRPSWKTVLISLLAFLIVVFAAPLLILPWSPQLLSSLAFGGPWGMANPSALNLINSLAVHSHGVSLPENLNILVWLYYAVTLLLVSVFALRRAWVSEDATLWVLTLTALFVLLNPRPVAYGYFLAIPAMFALVPEALKFWRLGTVALAISAQAVVGAFVRYEDAWMTNLAFLILLTLWLLYAYWCARQAIGVKRQGPGIDPRPFAPRPKAGRECC